MKIYTSEHIKALEHIAVEDGVSMEMLMDNAGRAVAEFILAKTDVRHRKIAILCGKGNNGGDGYVAANILFEHEALVEVILTQGEPASELSQNAFGKLQPIIPVMDYLKNPDMIHSLVKDADIIVDAVFGFGFKGEIKEPLAGLIELANNNTGMKFAVDVPSGVHCDIGTVSRACFRADYTITFTGIKPGLLVHPGKSFCGEVHVASVGINQTEINSHQTHMYYLSDKEAKALLINRNPVSNKGSFGKLLMICGSMGMLGACMMAAKGALRSGVGLLNIAVTKELYPMIAPHIPEPVYTILDYSTEEATKESEEKLESAIKSASAIVCGCGLGKDAEKYVPLLIEEAEVPMVLDADALNCIANNMDLIEKSKSQIIVTPHPGEMSRLTGKSIADIQSDRINTASNFAEKHSVITVLKGSGTVISAPDGETWLNLTGNAGMAKGGSGDVLAGIISSLLAQGMKPEDAAVLGVFIHGRAGDIATEKFGQISMLPTDLIDCLPDAYKSIN
ncbi:MAG: NAD(P)H-hydrate dehydratase [Clostridia bacterium]|nr:NAD(P)H-hydrate dehydratase [Clostridia bacterium]